MLFVCRDELGAAPFIRSLFAYDEPGRTNGVRTHLDGAVGRDGREVIVGVGLVGPLWPVAEVGEYGGFPYLAERRLLLARERGDPRQPGGELSHSSP